MRTMTIPIVDSTEGHAEALKRIRELWMAEDGTDESAERESLIILVREYEARTEAWEPLTPVETVRGLMEAKELTPKDLIPVFGDKAQVSLFLRGRRKMSVNQALRMKERFGIPLERLLVADFAAA